MNFKISERKNAAPSKYPQDIPKSAIKLFWGHLCPVPLCLQGKLSYLYLLIERSTSTITIANILHALPVNK